MFSSNAVIDNYETAMVGMKSYHKFISEVVKTNHPQVALPVPVKVALNNRNINAVRKSILNSYRYDDEESLDAQIRASPFWSIMHDGITKFNTGFNGVFLRCINEDSEL